MYYYVSKYLKIIHTDDVFKSFTIAFKLRRHSEFIMRVVNIWHHSKEGIEANNSLKMQMNTSELG